MRISLLSLAVAAVFTAKNTPQASASLLSVSQAAHLQAALKRDPPYRLPGLMNFGLPEEEVYALLLQESVRHEMEHGDRDCVGMVGEESSRYLSEPEELPSDEMKLKLMVDINTQRCLHDAPMIPWSDCTARGAQKWASQDRVEPLASYLEPPCGGPAGRAYSWGVPTVDEAVQTWMNEEDLWEEGAQKAYNPQAANYTTMVWRGVRNFGCGWEANQQLLICHFKADDYFNCRTPLTEGCFEYHVHRRNDMSECDCRNEAVTFAHTQLNLNVPELPNCSETTTTTEVPRDWWKDWVNGKPTQPPHTALTADQDQAPSASPSIFQRLRAQFTGIQTNTETGISGEATPNRPVKGVISAKSIFEPGSWMIDPTKTDPNSLQTGSGVNAVIDTQVPRFKNGSEPFRTLKIEFPTEQPSVGGFNLMQKQDQDGASVSLLEQSNTTTVATTTALPKVDQQKWEWEGVWGPGMVPNAPVKTQTQTTATKLSLRAAGEGLVRRHGFVL